MNSCEAPTFLQKQSRRRCMMHSINNLLQKNVAKCSDMDVIARQISQNTTIPLNELMNRRNGYYDWSVAHRWLEQHGFQVDVFELALRNVRVNTRVSDNLIGFIVVSVDMDHAYAIRYTGNDCFYVVDSTKSRPQRVVRIHEYFDKLNSQRSQVRSVVMRVSGNQPLLNTNGMTDGITNERCEICRESACDSQGPHRMLLCDGPGCNRGMHMNCGGLTRKPRGDWFCSQCAKRKQMNLRPKQVKSNDKQLLAKPETKPETKPVAKPESKPETKPVPQSRRNKNLRELFANMKKIENTVRPKPFPAFGHMSPETRAKALKKKQDLSAHNVRSRVFHLREETGSNQYTPARNNISEPDFKHVVKRIYNTANAPNSLRRRAMRQRANPVMSNKSYFQKMIYPTKEALRREFLRESIRNANVL